jgi:hypothetical protein
MSDRDRLLVAAAAIGLAICSLLWSVVAVGRLAGLETYGGYSQQSPDETGDNSRAADPQATRNESPKEENRAAADRQEARDEADVSAQESMARAAWWQVRIGIVGLLGLGGTVYFAGLAWRAARDAVDVTRKIGEAQVRAYLVIRNPSVSWSWGATGLMISFDVENTGNSPALDFNYTFLIRLSPFWVMSYSDLHVSENSPQYPDFPANGDRSIPVRGTEQINNHMATDFPLGYGDIKLLSGSGAMVWVSIATRFKDVFGHTIEDLEHFLTVMPLKVGETQPMKRVTFSMHSMAPKD